MRKIVLSLALICSCAMMTSNVHAQAIKAGATQVTGAQASDVTIPDPPHFQSEAVNAGVKQIVDLIKQYAPAIREKDTSKTEEFQTKMVALQQSAGDWTSQLSEDERQTFMEYFQKLQQILSPEGAADDSDDGN